MSDSDSITVTVVDLYHLSVATDFEHQDAHDWIIVPSDLVYGNVQVIDATVDLTGDYPVWLLEVTALSPGGSYTLTALFDLEESPNHEESDDFSVIPGVLLPDGSPAINPNAYPLPWPMKNLEALTYTYGKEIQYYRGGGAAILSEDFKISDTVLKIEGSTLEFPADGWVSTGIGKSSLELHYDSKTDTTFNQVTGIRSKTIPRGTILLCLYKRIMPPVYDRYRRRLTE